MAKHHDFLGTGWQFPPAFNQSEGKPLMVSDVNDIIESLEILMGTLKGERVMMPDFGSDLKLQIFRNITDSQKTLISSNIKKAIINYESRIVVDAVVIDDTQAVDGLLNIVVEFTVRSTNNRRNIVYPFFLEEGNLIPAKLLGK